MMIRLLASTPIGLGVTAALVLLMQFLIGSGSETANPPVTQRFPVWLASIPPSPPPIDDRELLPRPQPPEPLPRTRLSTGIDLGGIGVPHPTPGPGPLFAERRVVPRYVDGPLVLMVAAQPAYPLRAKRPGLEGFVTVRFDVNERGRAHNVAVVESSNKVFEMAAIRAAEKFRFKPKVVDGRPLPSLGVSYRFRFELDD